MLSDWLVARMGEVKTVPSLCLLLVLILAPACGKRRTLPVPPPTPPPPDATTVRPDPAPGLMVEAEANFREGNLQRAAELYNEVLDGPAGSEEASARFGLALIHASPGSPMFDPAQAAGLLRPLAEAPDGPFLREARVVLDLLDRLAAMEKNERGLRQSLQRVSEELQKLKEIDLERRSRRP